MEKNFSMQDAMKLAQSDAGKQLYALLQQQNPQGLQNAIQDAAAGNYEEVKNTMASMLASPEVKELLKRFGGKADG